jgi:hypothetical protein
MNRNSSMTQTAAAIKAEVREALRLATEPEFHEVLQSPSPALATRLVQIAQRRRGRIEQLIVAIKEAFPYVARPNALAETAWNAVGEKIISDCIAAYFAVERAGQATRADEARKPGWS